MVNSVTQYFTFLPLRLSAYLRTVLYNMTIGTYFKWLIWLKSPTVITSGLLKIVSGYSLSPGCSLSMFPDSDFGLRVAFLQPRAKCSSLPQWKQCWRVCTPDFWHFSHVFRRFGFDLVAGTEVAAINLLLLLMMWFRFSLKLLVPHVYLSFCLHCYLANQFCTQFLEHAVLFGQISFSFQFLLLQLY